MNMDELTKEIINANKNSNYTRVILLFDKYLKDNNTISYDLLSIYQEALMKTGKKEEEINVLLKLKNTTRSQVYNIRLINLYLDLNKINEAIDVIDNDDKLKYYLLGKIFFLRGEHSKSLKMFEEYLNNKITDINYFYNTKDYINRINKHIKDNTFTEIYYDKFREQGNKLMPGYIIYSDKIGNKCNLTEANLDPHKKTRPYLIWKVNNEYIYVLPLSTSISKTNYVIKKNDYPNLKNDSTIFENFILLKDEDITSVVEHLSKEDYQNSMRFIYEKVLMLNKESRKTEKLFISNYMKRVKIRDNDIIVYRDNGKNIDSYFFIISSIDYKYEVVQVEKENERFVIKDKNKQSLNKKKPVFNVIKLSDEEKNDLIKQLENAYLVQDLCGKRITTSDKEKFIILYNLKNDYLAVSIPYSSSYSRFKLISKDTKFNIDGQINEEELNNLRYQLDENIKIKKLCIPGYTTQHTNVKAKRMRYKEKK